MNPTNKAHLLQLLKEQASRESRRQFYRMFPDSGPLSREHYPRHIEFIESTAQYNEPAFMAGNRTGKTQTAAYITTACMTGDYPAWWNGVRFDHPVDVWAAGDTSQTVRDVIQDAMLGPIDAIGTGMIPGDMLEGYKKKAGSVPDAIESFTVRHKHGGLSTCTFKSYDQKRKSFQGTAKHLIWLDEESPSDVYNECLTRIMTTNGIVMSTFTPLAGLSDVVLSFMPGGQLPGHEDYDDEFDDEPDEAVDGQIH